MTRSAFSKWNKVCALSLLPVLVFMALVFPVPVSGEVPAIGDTQEKLENISEEEQKVLKELFVIAQQLDALELEKLRIEEELEGLRQQNDELERTLEEKQKSYDGKLGVLKQVLGYYQRGGPATFLEILLTADSLSSFLLSLNVLKDISHNVGELLDTLDQEKAALQEQMVQLSEQTSLLEAKERELRENIHKNELLKQEKDDYLASLKTERSHYEEQLVLLVQMWEDCSRLFPEIVSEINRMIGESSITLEDMHLQFGLSGTTGYLEEETFHTAFQENSALSEVQFRFYDGEVAIEVPEKHLKLSGNFIIAGDTAIEYKVSSGTFYDIPLEEESIKELFANGPLKIDFADAVEGSTFHFTLKQVESRKGKLTFTIALGL